MILSLIQDTNDSNYKYNKVHRWKNKSIFLQPF